MKYLKSRKTQLKHNVDLPADNMPIEKHDICLPDLANKADVVRHTEEVVSWINPLTFLKPTTWMTHRDLVIWEN